MAADVSAESHLLRHQATFATVQDFCDLPAAYALLCCSRLAAELLSDADLYETSARRRALVGRIPPYVAFGLRTEDEARAIALYPALVGAPDVPAEVLSMASRVEHLEVEEECCLVDGSEADGDRAGQADAGRLPGRTAREKKLTAMEQARLTHLFAEGLRAYEAKDGRRSEELLEAALAFAPEDDVLLTRLADTCFQRYQAAEGDQREPLRARTLGLYRKAVRVNPASSLGFNGLSLFQENDEMRTRYLLRAVALDNGNAYALTNLGMCLPVEAGSSCRRPEEIALALLKRALAINPNLFYARPTVAHLHINLQQYDEAIVVLAEHIARRPEDRHSSQLHDYLVEQLGLHSLVSFSAARVPHR